MVKKLTLTQHQEIQVAALEVIDAVNRMRDHTPTGMWFGPFHKAQHVGTEVRIPARIEWPALEQSVQKLQRIIDNLPQHGRKPTDRTFIPGVTQHEDL